MNKIHKSTSLLIIVLAFIVVFWVMASPKTSQSDPQVTNTNKSSESLKFGLTEEQRRKIYIEVSDSEIRAIKEADAVYPPGSDLLLQNTEKYLEILGKLEKEYRIEILAKYGVDYANWKEILSEGVSKDWK